MIIPARLGRPSARNRNLLLASLSAEDYAEIRPLLEIVTLQPRRVLHHPGEFSKNVYFPRGGFLSVAVVLQNGMMVEVASIGREGLAGLGVKGPGRSAMTNTLVVVQGETECAYRMRTEDFEREMDKCGCFMDVVNDYTEAFLGVVMQSTGCNAAHGVDRRLAKWLLMAHDRVESAEFQVTQEFLAMMLGATRQTVTGASSMLQRRGLVRYQRGRIQIMNREGLEEASCECYEVTVRLLRRVLRGRVRARQAS